jgi:homoserine acetyltransferase
MQIACLPEERKMPKISFDPESGEHKVIGVITTVNVKHGGSLITETENAGVTTTTVEFNNGGYVSSTPKAEGLRVASKDVLITYTDDPNNKGGVTMNVTMDESVK